MEIFFSLIRSFREARDRRKQELAEMEKANKRRKLHHFQSPSSSAFEHQEFHVTFPVDQHHNHKHEEHEEHEEEEDDDDKLNLKLSL
ncbi:putative NPR1/NH1-interacting protein [Helianthus anomalus]